MRSKTTISGVILLFGLAGGCVGNRFAAPFPASRPPAAQEGTAKNLSNPVEMDEPTGAVTLPQALAVALMKNPELAAFSWERRAQDAATLQAGLLPNPTLDLEMEDLGVSTSPDTVPQRQHALQLSQSIEMGGKRVKRRVAAALSRDLAGWDYDAQRIDLFTQVSHAFTDLLSAQGQQGLAEDGVRLAEEGARVVSERVRAGKVSPIEETRANVAVASAGIERDRARNKRDAARKALAATWGSTIPRFDHADGALGPPAPVPDLAQLTARLAQSPALARWTTEIAQRRAAVDLEQSLAVPDLTLTGGLRRYESTEDHVFSLGLSLPLPLFDRNPGGIQAARDRLAKGEAERRAAEVRVTTALSDAYQALSTASIEATTLAEKVLPAATQVFEAVSEGYRLGKFGLLDVLDAQRTLRGAREQHLNALADYRHAVAEVERLIGGALD